MQWSGECKQYMQVYLDCLRKNGSNSTPCRVLNRDYLDCRMNRYARRALLSHCCFLNRLMLW